MKIGKLYIISAPSGAGKTSLVKQLRADLSGLGVSVSYTTRAMRKGEVHGYDYNFVSHDEFHAMLAQGAFLEHAQVFDNFYGTACVSVEEKLQQGLDVILEIDWQGAQQVKRWHPACISVFILPPSLAVLEHRLTARGQDEAQVIARRMQDAVAEISHYKEFDYVIVNDVFDEALMQLKAIIISQRLVLIRQEAVLQFLLKSLQA
ncbi:MAG: guanylate kinase [Methylovulum sp.]|jgi:guanylate kinase|nr:guanylate kinase [Methylovulum sp.]